MGIQIPTCRPTEWASQPVCRLMQQRRLSVAAEDFIWCGRRDSNSHTFRHYPLKIACLPISPRPRLLKCLGCMRKSFDFLAFQTDSQFNLKSYLSQTGAVAYSAYFVGICAAPDAGIAGGTAMAALPVTGTVVAGICAAPEAAFSGAVIAPAPSRTLVPVRGCALPKYAKSKVHTKKTAARTPVVRDKKLALPLAPNRLPEPPLPKAAPMSAPLPCCTKIRPIMPSAVSICTARTMVKTTFIFVPDFLIKQLIFLYLPVFMSCSNDC